MPVLIASSAARTCLGDEQETFAALLAGTSGVGQLRYYPQGRLTVNRGYQIKDSGEEQPLRAGAWLAHCVARAVAGAGLRPGQRVVALIGTGLRELRAVELWAADGWPLRAEDLHFGGAVRGAFPPVSAAITIANACSAGGHALALGQDLLELGDADAVIVAAADAMTESMLAIIGRFDEEPAERVRPFDAFRRGVLLGEGAAAVVLVRDDASPARPSARPLARLVSTGLSCDARHETAPDAIGIRRAMTSAFDRGQAAPSDIGLVFAHGTGTALNDVTEAAVLAEVFAGSSPGPLVTAVKGAVGHTSGTAALTSLALALISLRTGLVPPVVGLREPLPEGRDLRLVTGDPQPLPGGLVQVNAFGFGGVNAVSLVEVP
jgi:3-oxoacyl-[acyl-carrier-protein] synthase II